MKFTKTLLAVAIAGIAVAPMMASATTTLSGAVQLRLSGDDSDAKGDRPGTKAGDAGVSVGDVLVGVAAEQALNSGLTGYGSLRLDLDSFSSGKDQSADNVYVGVKGGFGDFRIGEVPNPGEYGQVNDILTDMGTGIDQGVSYVGSFGGATIGASYSPEVNQNVLGVGLKFAWNGLSFGVGMQNETGFTAATEESVGIVGGAVAVIPATAAAKGEETTNISAMVGFAFAGASVSLGYVALGDAATDNAGAAIDETAIVAKVGYSISGVSLGLTYDGQQESEDNQIRLDAGYDLGGGMEISSRINIFSDGATGAANEDKTDWRIQLAKSF